MKIIKERILAILVVIALFGLLSIGLLILSSNKYEDDIARLEIENKKLKYELITKRKDNEMMGYVIENLQAQVDEKKAVECNCSWYEDFYYEHMKEMGANE